MFAHFVANLFFPDPSLDLICEVCLPIEKKKHWWTSEIVVIWRKATIGFRFKSKNIIDKAKIDYIFLCDACYELDTNVINYLVRLKQDNLLGELGIDKKQLYNIKIRKID